MKKWGYVAIGAILSTCFTFSVLAASGSVSFNSVNLRLNGEQISAKGEDYQIYSGASVPASILYTDENGGGTTYLPIARLSELLGTPIGWDGSTGSVLIGEEPAVIDFSDWPQEKNAKYQEFLDLWDVQPQEKYIELYVDESVSAEEFLQFCNDNDNQMNNFANRFIVELFEQYHLLNAYGECFVSFNTYGGSAWGGGYNPTSNRVSNTYNLESIQAIIEHAQEKSNG